MALTGELLKQLDDEEEPIAKRFKIADDAFKSSELAIQNREVVLLKWLLKLTDDCNVEAWTLFHDWLKSEQVTHLRLTDVTLDDVRKLSGVIENCLTNSSTLDPKIKSLALNSALLLMENAVIRHYFKHDLKNYLKLAAHILESIDEIEVILRFIKSRYLYYKSYFPAENFHKYFINLNLTMLVNVVDKFGESEVVYQEISAILQHRIFQMNFKNFKEYFKMFFEENSPNKTHSSLPKQLIKYLQKSYKSDSPNIKLTFKLLMNAFCESCTKDFSLVYMFLIIIYDLIGFDFTNRFKMLKSAKVHATCNFHKSMDILAEVLDVISAHKVVLDSVVCNTSFSDFIQGTIASVIYLSETPSKTILKIINHSVALNPLVVEQIINSETLSYIMLANNRAHHDEYEKLILNVFEIFAKLNRVEHFISKMIQTLKPASDDKRELTDKMIGFDGVIEREPPSFEDQIQNVLPDAVLAYFTQCITTLTSRQMISLFKIFQVQLESVVNDDLQSVTKDPQCVMYIEILCTLTYQFLKSVRMAEHTMTNVEKYVDCMEEFKAILGKYGNALVAMEHNLTLMRMYLKMSYIWGELYIILSYYSINNEISFTKSLDSDYSACNITYLHSYLTTEQWCLISQRITNFGEKPCKQLMFRLFTQRVKSMQLFESNVNEEIISSYIKSLTQSLEDCWEIAVQDSFILNTVMPRMQTCDVIKLAGLLIREINGRLEILKTTKGLENHIFVNAMVYLLMLKINKVFKHKRKQDLPSYQCTYIFDVLNENSCLLEGTESEETMQKIVGVFHTLLCTEQKMESASMKLNVNKILSYLGILKSLPILSLTSNVQTILLIYLTSVLNDVKINASSYRDLQDILESILTGVIQNGAVSFTTLDYQVLIKCVLQTFTNYASVSGYIIEKMFKTEDDLKSMKNVVGYLLENLNCAKCQYCAGLILSGISKHRKSRVISKMKDEVQECKVLINDKAMKLVTSKDEVNANDLFNLYTLLLKDSLSHENVENFNVLLLHLDRYIEIAINNSGVNNINNKNRIGLFATILLGKNKFDMIKDNFILNLWNACMAMNISDDDFEEYSKLIAMIVEHISNEDFTKIMNELLEVSIKTLKDKDYDSFMKELNIWDSILCCSFSAMKINTCQDAFESLLHEIIMIARDSDVLDRLHKNITRFVVHLIETSQFSLTATILDLVFLLVDLLIGKSLKFTDAFLNCIKITEALLKFRSIYISDRLPSFLQQYRVMLTQLIAKSNEDLQLSEEDVKQLSDCSHMLEKLTKRLLVHGKHLQRIAMYLIADILNQYETVAVHPSVKMHVNNCVYDLMSLCDQHAVSFLMRSMSTASTEVFKFMFTNYKKYYRFTGKV